MAKEVHETKSNSKANARQQGALLGFLTEVFAKIIFGLSPVEIEYWLGKKTQLQKLALKMLKEQGFLSVPSYGLIRDDWERFYQTEFGLTVDFSEVVIPESPDQVWRLIFVGQGLTCNQVYDSWKFPKWQYEKDLDTAVPTNVRVADHHYAIWVRDGIEPDQEFLGQSTRKADADMKIGMTLLERMVLESKYFAETGKHLDNKGLTLCSGSRHAAGHVPLVYLLTDGKVNVHWCNLDRAHDRLGIRRAVS